MQAPFVAVGWRPGHQIAEAAAWRCAEELAACGWSRVVRRAGLDLWRREGRPAPWSALDGADGVLVGRAFPRREGRRIDTAASPDGAPARRARTFVREFWGAYVAFLRDPTDGRWRILRDPSGAVEAYTWRAGDLTVCAPGLRGLPHACLPPRLALDWSVIAGMLRQPWSRAGGSPLEGLEWVAPGSLQPLGAGRGEAEPIWRPADCVASEATLDPDPTRRLRDVVSDTVARLVGPYERVLTEASGGLDSSIVNCALAITGLAPRVQAALHYVGDRPEADERRWAAAVCERAGLPLRAIDRAIEPVDPDRDFAPLCDDARPPFGALDAARDRDAAERLTSCRAGALVTGRGGDAIFFQMPTPLVVADLWRAKGALEALRDPVNTQVAQWLRRSVWSVWREALGAAGEADVPHLAAFVGPALQDLPPPPVHPWLADLDDVPPGKRLQILGLAAGHSGVGLHRRGEAADVIHPLQAQPVMELCLSIPSFELVRGGRDRALAREAFAPWLPAAVAQRRSKGTLTSFYSRRAALSAEALKAHLLDGVLVRAGLLDGARVEAALDPDQLIRRVDGADLVGVAAIESWVRRWQAYVPDAAGVSRPWP